MYFHCLFRYEKSCSTFCTRLVAIVSERQTYVHPKLVRMRQTRHGEAQGENGSD
jgi:hypothetical protein